MHSPQRNRVRLYVSILLAVVAIEAAAALAFVNWQDDRYQAVATRAAEYHLVTSSHANRMKEEMFQLQLKILSPGPGRVPTGEMEISLHFIEMTMEKSRSLQVKWGMREFERTHLRAQRLFEALHDQVHTQPIFYGENLSDALPEAGAFQLTLAQLRRLHMAAYQESVADLNEQSQRNASNLLIFFGALIVLGGVVAFQVFRLIRRTLARQAEAEEALREANEGLEEKVRARNADIMRAFRALETSERRFSTVMNAVPSMIAFIDAEERYLLVNRAYAKMVGQFGDEIHGRTVAEVVGPEAYAEIQPLLRRAMRGETVEWEREVTLPNGETRWLSGNYMPLHSDVGPPQGVVAQINDITERKKMEEDLRNSEERFRQIAENMDDVMYLTTPDKSKVLYMNAAFERAYGHPVEWIYEDAQRFRTLLHPEDVPIVDRAIEEQLKGNFDIKYEFRILRDEKVCYLRAQVFPIRDETGTVIRVAGIHTDITDLKMATEKLEDMNRNLEELVVERAAELHASEVKYRALLSAAPDAIITVDGQARIVLANDQAEGLFGYDRSELIGQPIEMLVPERLREGHIGHRNGFLASPRSRRFQADANLVARRKDGTELPIELSLSPAQTPDGTLVTAIVRDISIRKAAEDALESRARQQAAVAELGQLALGNLPLQALMERAVCVVEETLSAELCKILELLPDGGELLLRAGVGWDDGLVGHGIVGADLDSQAGFTLLSDEPVIVRDLKTETRFDGPPLLHDHGVRSGISVIIRGSQRPYGVMGAHSRTYREFTKEDGDFLQSVANLLAEAIERHRAEEALRTRESQLAEAQRIGAMGSWKWDIGTGDVSWSDEIYRIFGLTPQSFGASYKAFLNTIHPEDRDLVTSAIELALEGEVEPCSVDHRIVLPDGTIRIVHERGEVARNESGEPVRMTGTVQDITERKKVEDQLEASLREKEALLKEIHHRVKNNLQVITSLLTLQSNQTTDERALGILNESQGRVRSIALVHEKLYQSADLASIDFADYCRSLSVGLFRTYGVNPDKISLDIGVHEHPVSVEAAIPCGLILSELLSNALKYAFPDGRQGHIRVALENKDAETCSLSVRDDGIGLPDGFDVEKSESLGLKLVHTLAAQLGGRAQVSSDGGTAVEILFPRPDRTRSASDAVTTHNDR